MHKKRFPAAETTLASSVNRADVKKPSVDNGVYFGFELEENFSAYLLKGIINILGLWPLDLDLVFKSYISPYWLWVPYILMRKGKKQKEQIW